ncbi:MAG: cation transporter, partial [Gammaproteobacteria bacterium]|nr:cation transporter [Gammaproteobacteria bacterium]
YRATVKVTLIGAVLDLVLGVAKIVVGVISHSQALIADGVHSLSDLGTDIVVLYAAKHSHREADEDHPYGHGRIETVATVILGTALIAVAIGIGYDSVQRLFHPDELLQPGMLALIVAGVSVVSKEAIYHYTMRVAKRLRSNMLKANAWHSRSDAISSVVVMIGVGGTMAGLPYLDAIAAVLVSLMIIKIGWELAWHSVQELVDTGLDADRVEASREVIQTVDGVHELHMLRTRRMGADALVDVHIIVDPKISVSEGHYISETVRSQLIKQVEEVQDVLVHIDPEDDEKMAPSMGLPSRSEIKAALEACWKELPEAEQIQRITLHYLDGKIWVEVVLPLAVVTDAVHTDERTKALKQAVTLDYVQNVEVHYL